MRNQVWDSSSAQLNPLDLPELIFGFVTRDTVDGEATLCIIDQTEVLVGLFDGDNIHEAGRIGRIGPHLAIDLDQPLHDNRFYLTTIESILETVEGASVELYLPKGWSYRFRMKTIRGMQSRSLCGPVEALGA